MAGMISSGVHPPLLSYRGTSLIRNRDPLGPCSRTMPRVLWWFWRGCRFPSTSLELWVGSGELVLSFSLSLPLSLSISCCISLTLSPALSLSLSLSRTHAHTHIRRGNTGMIFSGIPLSSEYGTQKKVKARFRPWFSGESTHNLQSCSLFARKR